MKNLIDHLKETLEEEKKEIVGYIKLRPAIIDDIVQREQMETPEFTKDDITDEFMLDWIDNIDCMDYYDNSIYDAGYLNWYEAAIRHAEHYPVKRLFLVSSNYINHGRWIPSYKCNVHEVVWTQVYDITQDIAEKMWQKYKNWSLIIYHWSWTWFMRISKHLRVMIQGCEVKDTSVIY